MTKFICTGCCENKDVMPCYLDDGNGDQEITDKDYPPKCPYGRKTSGKKDKSCWGFCGVDLDNA